MTEQMHTPTPWDYVEGKTLLHVETHIDNPAGGGLPVCSIPRKREADAALIVRAVNAHDDMLALLRWLDRKGGLGLDVHERIRAAISKAQVQS